MCYNGGIMDQSELKTSTKQRIAILLIAVIMVGSIIASYAAIVASGNSSASTQITEEKLGEYIAAYQNKLSEFKETTAGDFAKFSKYTSQITSYDEETANGGGVVSKDLSVGDGRILLEGDTDYLAYYAGWCADGTIFDSSLDDTENPTAFSKVLNASAGMITGWNTGVTGMQLGGVRVITVPGEQAYGENMEICGGYNKPLKFLILAVENADPLKTEAYELDQAYLRYQYGLYGIDYDAVVTK